jgi:chromosome partitioning protein
MAKTIVWANHKGGVGKTTGAANTSAAHAETGARVLAVDLDPQGHLGELFAVEQHPGRPRLEHVLLRQAPVRDAIVAVGGRLDVLPCSEGLAEAQFTVAADEEGHRRLQEILEPLQGGYDYIVLDSPPGIGFWSGMALVTAQWAIIPTLAEDLAVLSSGKIADFIERVVADANPSLQLLGVVLTQAKPTRWRLMKDTTAQFQTDGLRELGRIPKQEQVARALRHGRPTVGLEPDGSAARAYRESRARSSAPPRRCPHEHDALRSRRAAAWHGRARGCRSTARGARDRPTDRRRVHDA